MANELKFTGVLVKHLPEQTGQSQKGPWVKRHFVLQGQSQYDKPFPVSVFGNKGEILPGIAEGEELTVYLNLEGREYNEKWYPEISAWKIERANGQTTERQQSSPAYVPPVAQSKPIRQQPVAFFGDEEQGDLPF